VQQPYLSPLLLISDLLVVIYTFCFHFYCLLFRINNRLLYLGFVLPFEKRLLSHIAAHMAGHAAKARIAGMAAVAPGLAINET
jgi:hypothetical protein